MTSTREDLDRLTAAVDRTGATVLDHGHHVVELGRKQAEVAAKRAQRETRAAAKKARKRSAAVWAEFADEASQRATNVLAAGRGEKVVTPSRRRAPLLVAVAGGAIALVFVLRARAARALQPVPAVPTDLPTAPVVS